MLETARLAMSDIRDVMEVTASGGVVIFASEDWSEPPRVHRRLGELSVVSSA